MTCRRDLKKLIRQRMAKTGESYTVARMHVRAKVEAAPVPVASDAGMPGSLQNLRQQLLDEPDKAKVLKMVLEQIGDGAVVYLCEWKYLAMTTAPTIQLARERLEQASRHGWLGTEDVIHGETVKVHFPVSQLDEVRRRLEQQGANVITDVGNCQDVEQQWRFERNGIEV